MSVYKDKEIHVCIICNESIEGMKDFIKHLIETHSSKLIEKFDKNSSYNKSKEFSNMGNNFKNELSQKKKQINESNIESNKIKQNNESNIESNKKKQINESDIESNKKNERSKTKTNIEITKMIENNESIIEINKKNDESNKSKNEISKNNFENTNNYSSIDTKSILKINENNNIKKFDISTDDTITHCNKEKLNCICCKDKICQEGNCYCPKCMKLNIEKKKLINGELINKSGHIAKRKKKNNEIRYFCGCKYLKEVNLFEGKKKIEIKCDSDNPCDDCQKLIENIFIYQNLLFKKENLFQY